MSPHHEIETLISFNYLNLFNPNEQTEDYHIRKPNDGIFLFEIEDRKYIHMGEKVVTFETNVKNVSYSSDHGFNDIKHPLVYGEENFLGFIEN